ncbi:MAG: DUF4190 domain-containing protein, partial [Clostridiales bacterium]|nr:DUF4190 domain-containing protein [Clostridiales bacterium]
PAPAPAPAAQPVQPVYQQPQAQPVQPVYQPQQPVYQQPQAQPVQPVYQPVYQQPIYNQASATNAKAPNGAATAALVFGIITLVLFWIPFFNIFTTGILGLLGLIFSIVGLAKKNGGGKAKAVVGLVLTIIGIVATIGYYGLVWQTIVTDPSLSQQWDDIWEDTSAKEIDNSGNNIDGLYIDGDYLNTDNGYVTGVLHIDGYRVDF